MQYHYSQVVYILCTRTVYMIQCLEFLKWFAQGSNCFVWCKREMVLPLDNELLMNHEKNALIIWSEVNLEIVINIIFLFILDKYSPKQLLSDSKWFQPTKWHTNYQHLPNSLFLDFWSENIKKNLQLGILWTLKITY